MSAKLRTMQIRLVLFWLLLPFAIGLKAASFSANPMQDAYLNGVSFKDHYNYGVSTTLYAGTGAVLANHKAILLEFDIAGLSEVDSVDVSAVTLDLYGDWETATANYEISRMMRFGLEYGSEDDACPKPVGVTYDEYACEDATQDDCDCGTTDNNWGVEGCRGTGIPEDYNTVRQVEFTPSESASHNEVDILSLFRLVMSYGDTARFVIHPATFPGKGVAASVFQMSSVEHATVAQRAELRVTYTTAAAGRRARLLKGQQ